MLLVSTACLLLATRLSLRDYSLVSLLSLDSNEHPDIQVVNHYSANLLKLFDIGWCERVHNSFHFGWVQAYTIFAKRMSQKRSLGLSPNTFL